MKRLLVCLVFSLSAFFAVAQSVSNQDTEADFCANCELVNEESSLGEANSAIIFTMLGQMNEFELKPRSENEIILKSVPQEAFVPKGEIFTNENEFSLCQRVIEDNKSNFGLDLGNCRSKLKQYAFDNRHLIIENQKFGDRNVTGGSKTLGARITLGF